MYGFTFEQALHMAASFGGGIGRMREICGAACGMFLLAGLERCAVEGADREGKAANYKLVQELISPKSLRKNVEPSIAANCWACQRKNLL